MSAADDRFREDTLMEQALEEWKERNLAYLWEVCADEIPWNDAGPEGGKGDSGDEGNAAA